jgi:3-hydroxyisobutyrate dehydrogenase
MRIGWVGTGIMGLSMAGHLLDAGHELTVTTRTAQRARPLLERGATWADSPAAVADGAEAVFTMLGYPSDVREVVLGSGPAHPAHPGLLYAMAPGSLLVDTTTSEPSLAVEIHAAAAARGVQALDAPVSGGDVGAREATLAIMAGGEPEAFERARPLLQAMGRAVTLQGGPGAGQHTKMVNQIAIAGTMVGVCEALLYAQRSGLDADRVLEAIAGGAAGSWSLANLAPRALRGDLAPGFKVDHFVKDLGIAVAEARRMRLALPGLALAEQLYVAAQGQGRGEDGTQALVAALAALSGASWEPTAAVGG